MKPRTIVIGDIHGGLLALRQLLEAVAPQGDDTLIFLGDYVDGWSESAQLIDALIALERKHYCIFLRGNHDAWCEDWLAGNQAQAVWLHNGGDATVESYARHREAKRDIHLDFFERMRPFYTDDRNRLFIHAGFSSMHGPAHEPFESNCYWDRTLWEVALGMDVRVSKDSLRYPKRLRLFPEIYIGHTPTQNCGSEVPVQACNVWNIDTGAGFYGRISALEVDTKQVWQSDPVYQLYPNHTGRNH